MDASSGAGGVNVAAPLRVLLVDDMAELRDLLARVLERDGRYVVVGHAGDGREGVSRAAELQPDLVLLDLTMPVMDGLEALPLLRRAAPSADVVVLSGLDDPRSRQAAADAGALASLPKGLTPRDLLARLVDLVPHRPPAP